MDYIWQFVDLFLHLDTHLKTIIEQYGTLTYLILFLIIFAETGLVVTPFLPGDSLLFAVGTFAALGLLDVAACIGLLFVAAVLGDTVNYWIGKRIGPQVFERNYRLLKKEYLLKTQEFYEKHGGKTIVFARFLPIIRTFAPFIAGVGTMNYQKFILYNVFGGAIWVVGFTLLGYFFGNIPAVKSNFTLVILGIISLSVLPPIIEFLRKKYGNKR
ncbi:MAG: DedA family protein [Cytophagales bacterium]|nr:MAG: DedA family protein [Cytophagales bacterium]